ncbi:Fic family protein [Cellulomonas fengjieae]|uniref:Fic family protein n=1 Tax=Cellulomonas fengjieae TaxID=2819978 RepID=UPI001AAEBED0|nr:Fic family protein [Cellulomonas fengjieae]MBO3102987.1 Fic family protein [Cellulomonas fengjieae]
MGRYVTQQWTPRVTDGVPRRYTRSGTYRAFVPDSLLDHDLPASPHVTELLDEAESRAREAADLAAHPNLGQVGDLLVRSEATASSLIEGYEPTPRAVAVADFVARGRQSAVTVARNLHAVRGSAQRALDPDVSLVRDVVELQRLITPRHAGIRTEPVWIGGRTPLEAHYNAPPHELVPGLLDDLDAYLSSQRHRPVLAAALAHAQLETIHPFADGNGRAGRVLIGTVLARYGLAPRITLPVSTALFRDRERYYAALDTFRRGDQGVAIVTVVAEAVSAAAVDALRLSAQVTHWQRRQRSALDVYLRDRSPTGRVRRGVAYRLLDDLPAHPVVDAASAAARYDVTPVAARNALESLTGAGVLRPDKKADRTRTVYVATELLDLVAEPGTAAGADPEPAVDVPVVAVDPEAEAACGAWLPRAGRTCRLPRDHRGQHR